MKTSSFFAKTVVILSLAVWVLSNVAMAQRPKMTVLNIDAQNTGITSQQMGNLVRTEVSKFDMFEVMDKYDAAYMIQKHKLVIDNCYGKICLIEVGKTIGADKMLGGSVESFGENIIIDLRMIDVKSESVERSQVKEFLNLPQSLPDMINITLRQMLKIPHDTMLENQLTKVESLESTVTNPNVTQLNLSGPRMGFTYFTGKNAQYLADAKSNGGYDAFPVMFQFGYQWEIQYLNEGHYQALFEFIPTITGIDQGLIIPSITVFNGFRNSYHGWEVGIGPSFGLAKMAEGFNQDNKWVRTSEVEIVPDGAQVYTRLDSRGNLRFTSSFIVAIGKTFRSGRLNIPLNLYAVPSKNGFRFGFSFGYNAKKAAVGAPRY